MEEVREYERTMTEKTNSKVKSSQSSTGETALGGGYLSIICEYYL